MSSQLSSEAHPTELVLKRGRRTAQSNDNEHTRTGAQQSARGGAVGEEGGWGLGQTQGSEGIEEQFLNSHYAVFARAANERIISEMWQRHCQDAAESKKHNNITLTIGG